MIRDTTCDKRRYWCSELGQRQWTTFGVLESVLILGPRGKKSFFYFDGAKPSVAVNNENTGIFLLLIKARILLICYRKPQFMVYNRRTRLYLCCWRGVKNYF